MTTVIVRQYGGSLQIRLKRDQLRLFNSELRHARKHAFVGTGVPYRLAPDCVITVRTAGKTKKYELYGRAVLLEEKSKKKWQFYFGLLLLEWLYTT